MTSPTYITARANEIKVDSDERGFELHVSTDDHEFVFNVHGVAVDLYNEVVTNIGPWIAEGLAARATMPPDYDPREAYDPLDPKHPDFLANADLIRDRMRGK